MVNNAELAHSPLLLSFLELSEAVRVIPQQQPSPSRKSISEAKPVVVCFPLSCSLCCTRPHRRCVRHSMPHRLIEKDTVLAGQCVVSSCRPMKLCMCKPWSSSAHAAEHTKQTHDCCNRNRRLLRTGRSSHTLLHRAAQGLRISQRKSSGPPSLSSVTCNEGSDKSLQLVGFYEQPTSGLSASAICCTCRLGFKIEQRALLRRHIQQLQQCLDRASAELRACL